MAPAPLSRVNRPDSWVATYALSFIQRTAEISRYLSKTAALKVAAASACMPGSTC